MKKDVIYDQDDEMGAVELELLNLSRDSESFDHALSCFLKKSGNLKVPLGYGYSDPTLGQQFDCLLRYNESKNLTIDNLNQLLEKFNPHLKPYGIASGIWPQWEQLRKKYESDSLGSPIPSIPAFLKFLTLSNSNNPGYPSGIFRFLCFTILVWRQEFLKRNHRLSAIPSDMNVTAWLPWTLFCEENPETFSANLRFAFKNILKQSSTINPSLKVALKRCQPGIFETDFEIVKTLIELTERIDFDDPLYLQAVLEEFDSTLKEVLSGVDISDIELKIIEAINPDMAAGSKTALVFSDAGELLDIARASASKTEAPSNLELLVNSESRAMLVLARAALLEIDRYSFSVGACSEFEKESKDLVVSRLPINTRISPQRKIKMFVNSALGRELKEDGPNSPAVEPMVVKNIAESLRPGGQAIMIVGDGFLSKRDKEFIDIRKYLLENIQIERVISLQNAKSNPLGVESDVSARRNILIIRKQAPSKPIEFSILSLGSVGNRPANPSSDHPDWYEKLFTHRRRSAVPQIKATWAVLNSDLLGDDYSLLPIEPNTDIWQEELKKIEQFNEVEVVKLGDLFEIFRGAYSKQNWKEADDYQEAVPLLTADRLVDQQLLPPRKGLSIPQHYPAEKRLQPSDMVLSAWGKIGQCVELRSIFGPRREGDVLSYIGGIASNKTIILRQKGLLDWDIPKELSHEEKERYRDKRNFQREVNNYVKLLLRSSEIKASIKTHLLERSSSYLPLKVLRELNIPLIRDKSKLATIGWLGITKPVNLVQAIHRTLNDEVDFVFDFLSLNTNVATLLSFMERFDQEYFEEKRVRIDSADTPMSHYQRWLKSEMGMASFQHSDEYLDALNEDMIYNVLAGAHSTNGDIRVVGAIDKRFDIPDQEKNFFNMLAGVHNNLSTVVDGENVPLWNEGHPVVCFTAITQALLNMKASPFYERLILGGKSPREYNGLEKIFVCVAAFLDCRRSSLLADADFTARVDLDTVGEDPRKSVVGIIVKNTGSLPIFSCSVDFFFAEVETIEYTEPEEVERYYPLPGEELKTSRERLAVDQEGVQINFEPGEEKYFRVTMPDRFLEFENIFTGEKEDANYIVILPEITGTWLGGMQRQRGYMVSEDRFPSGDLKLEITGESRTNDTPMGVSVDATSPYVAGNTILDENLFFGRAAILTQIKQQISGKGEQSNPVLLEGNRRTGKSSILMKLKRDYEREKANNILPVYVTFQGGNPSLTDSRDGLDTVEVFRLIAENIAYALEGKGTPIVLGDYTWDGDNAYDFVNKLESEFKVGQPYTRFSAIVKQVLRAIYPQTLLLMLDEFDEIYTGIRSGVTHPQVLKNIRAVVHENHNLALILAGTLELNRRREEYWSELFGFAHPIAIKGLEDNEARELVTIPARNLLRYKPEAVSEVVRLCDKQPFLIQSLANRIFSVACDGDDSVITLATVESGASAMARNDSHFHSLFYVELKTDQQRMLILMFCEESGKTIGLSRLAQIQLFANKEVPLNEECLDDDIDRLLDLEILRESSISQVSTNSIQISGFMRSMGSRDARLSASIEKEGIREPLEVREIGRGQYQVIDGAKRLSIARNLKISHVPIQITQDYLDSQAVRYKISLPILTLWIERNIDFVDLKERILEQI